MAAHVLVRLVLVKHAMDVDAVTARPLHELVDDHDRLAWIVDVHQQVTDAVDDYQSQSFVLLQGIVDEFHPHARTVLPETEEHKVLAVYVSR